MTTSHRIPAPSPHGTNRAGLLPASKFAGAVAAYDAKPKWARDQEEKPEEENLDGVSSGHPCASALAFARGRLSGSNFQVLRRLLGEVMLREEPPNPLENEDDEVPPEKQHAIEKEDDEAQAVDRRRKLGKDEPPPFSGRPRPGGKMDPIKQAQDMAWESIMARRAINKHGVPGLPPAPMAFDASRQAADEALQLAGRIKNQTVRHAPTPLPVSRGIAMDAEFEKLWPEAARIKIL